MKGNVRKHVSLLLTLSMVLGAFGTTAFAADSYVDASQAQGVAGLTTTGSALKYTTGASMTINSVEGHTTISVNGTVVKDSQNRVVDFKDVTVGGGEIDNEGTITMTSGSVLGITGFTVKQNLMLRAARATGDSIIDVQKGIVTNDIVGGTGANATVTVGKDVTAKNVTGGTATTGDATVTVSGKVDNVTGGTAATGTSEVVLGEGADVALVTAGNGTTSKIAIESGAKTTNVAGIANVNTAVKVDGEVLSAITNVSEVEVTGTVADISGASTVTIGANATVHGDIEATDKVTIAEGATLNENTVIKVPEGATVESEVPVKVEEVATDGSTTAFYNLVLNNTATSADTATVKSEITKVGTTETVVVPALPTGWTNGTMTFEGWTVAADGTGDVLSENDTLDIAGAPVLYTKWSSSVPTTYDITLHKNTQPDVTQVETLPITNGEVTIPNLPTSWTNGDMNFVGWTAVADGTGTVYTTGSTLEITTNIRDLYAKWSNDTPSGDTYPLNVYIERDYKQALTTIDRPIMLKADGTKYITLPAKSDLPSTFRKSGSYIFRGWLIDGKSGYATPGTEISVPTEASMNIYGYWSSSSSSSGGGGGGGNSTKYTITASAGKGGSISPSGDVSVVKGNDKTFKITPDEGYLISDVTVDGKSVGKVKSYTIENVRDDMTIKATFETESGEPADKEDEENNNQPDKTTSGTFTDTTSHWAKDYINTVVEKGWFSGMTAKTFEPDTAMTRAMFVTVLGRVAGINTSEYTTSKFSDVPANSWYGPYVNWAASKGIASGLTSTTFGPDESITREQMAVLLVNFAKVQGNTLPTVNSPVQFTDNASISSWARDAVSAAQKAGLINGRTDGSFDPQGKATRAEVATVFVQMDKLTASTTPAADVTAAESTTATDETKSDDETKTDDTTKTEE